MRPRPGKTLLSIGVLFASLGLAHSANANLLTNPGFETGDLTGWTLTSVGDGVACAGGAGFEGASEGSCALQLNGGNRAPDAILEQAFATVSGVTYDLSFDIGKFDVSRPAGAASVLVEVFDGAVLLAGFPQSAQDTTGGSNPLVPGDFVGFSASFVATNASTLLRITDQSTNGGINFDAVLDNFVVVVPEPSTALLFGSGLMLLASRRHRTRSVRDLLHYDGQRASFAKPRFGRRSASRSCATIRDDLSH